LIQVAGALRGMRFGLGARQRRQEHRRQNRDDRNDHEQFDQGKTGARR